MSIGERIRMAADSIDGQLELSRRTKISRGALGNYVSGRTSPQVVDVEKIAAATGKSARWIMFGDENDEHIQSDHILSGFNEETVPFEPEPSRNRRVPLYEARASAGNGAVVLSQSVMDHFDLPPEFMPRDLGHNARIGIMKSGGDSMEPTIRDGDFIIVRFDIDRIRTDGVYVVSYDGDVRVKRLTVNPGQVVLSSDNELHHAITMTREEADRRLIIHGLVFWAGGALRPWRA